MFQGKIARALALLFLVSLSGAANLVITGPLPPGTGADTLAAAYDSIYAALKPGAVPDTTPLAVIFTDKPLDRLFGLPEWGGGGALGADTIVVSIRNRPFLDLSPGRVALHEMVHIALKRAYPSVLLPRWLHEGLAMLLSGEIAMEEHVTVSRAIFSGGLIPLSSIDSVNLFPAFRADLAYCESHLAAGFLVRRYGLKAMAELLEAAQSERDFAKGFYDVYGLTLPEAEKMIHEDMIDRYRLVFLFADTYLFWIGTALLFVAGVAAVRIRNRRRLKEMEKDEGA